MAGDIISLNRTVSAVDSFRQTWALNGIVFNGDVLGSVCRSDAITITLINDMALAKDGVVRIGMEGHGPINFAFVDNDVRGSDFQTMGEFFAADHGARCGDLVGTRIGR